MGKKIMDQKIPSNQKILTDKEIKDVMLNNMVIDDADPSGVAITDEPQIDYMLRSIIGESDEKTSAKTIIYNRLQELKDNTVSTGEEKLKLDKFVHRLQNYYSFQTWLKKEVERLRKERDELKKENRRRKTGKYKKPGHLQDQMLKYDYPKDKNADLFSALSDRTKSKIDTRGVKHSQIVEGIRLTSSETKVVDTLCNLLHHNSQNLNSKEGKYYTGNKEPVMVRNGDGKALAPKLSFSLYEFTREYIGSDKKISGKDIKNVSTVLKSLEKKEFLIKYKEEIPLDNGGKRIRELEMFEKIVSLPTLRETDIDKKGIQVSKKEETTIVLHPIFRSQMDSKFILVPDDINKRTVLAYGSSNVSEVTLKLRDYLMRELSSKRYTPEIGHDRLYYQVAEKWMKQSRRAMVKKYLDKALKVVEELGLLESYEIKPSKGTGEPKIVFKLNKDFE